MTSHLTYLLLGLGGGAVIALLALGLVVTYQASGVVNFAHAALGTYVAFAFYRFRASGDLILPVLGLPAEVHLVDRPTVHTALAVCLLLAALCGAFLALVVFRPLRKASPLARVVASLGVMLYLIALIDLRIGTQGATALVIKPVLPTNIVRIGSTSVPADRLWLLAIVVLVTAALWAVSRFTRFGLATRAVAENERNAVLLGLRADTIALGNWVVASVLSALGVILAAPITRLEPTSTSLLVVPAIAAALVGRFSNLIVAVGTALAVGMAQSEILNLQADWTWLPKVGLQQGVPLLVIIVALALGASPPAARGTVMTSDLPSAHLHRHAEWIVLAVGAAAVATMSFAGWQWRLAIIVSAIATVTSLSVVVATGLVGQITLATSAFAGLAAFSLVKFGENLGLPFPLAPLLACLVSVLIGVAIGLPAVRVRGLTLAMATLAGALAVEELIFKWSWFTGGFTGARVSSPRFLGVDLGISAVGPAYPRKAFGYFVIVLAVLAVLAVTRLRRSATVRRWLAVRSNERAAAAIGIAVSRVKLSAFAFSAFLAGLAGTLTAYQRQLVSASSFASFSSIVVLAITYLAGIATPLGAIAAGVLASGGVLTVALGDEASRYQFAVNGLMLVVAAILVPDGLVGRTRRRRRGPGPEPAAAAA